MTTWSTRGIKTLHVCLPLQHFCRSYYLCIENYSAMKKSNYETVSFNWNARHIYHFPFFLLLFHFNMPSHINIKFAIFFSYIPFMSSSSTVHDHLSDAVVVYYFVMHVDKTLYLNGSAFLNWKLFCCKKSYFYSLLGLNYANCCCCEVTNGIWERNLHQLSYFRCWRWQLE
jgi:hypothetical protein